MDSPELIPVNDLLNKPTTRGGIDVRLWFLTPFVALPILMFGVLTHLSLFTAPASLLAPVFLLILPFLAFKKDRDFPAVVLCRLRAKPYYDPYK